MDHNMNIFKEKPDTAIAPAKSIAAGLLDNIEREATRRAGEHSDSWYAFWESSEATPQQIADEMGVSAALFFAIASANITHINEVAVLVGKTAADFMPAECLTTKQPVAINPDGTVTIG